MVIRPRILIVDDEPAVLITYRTILQQHGYDVTAASSSHAAKAALDASQFDVVLCDLTLEHNHSGFDVIDHAHRRTPQVRSVLLTGFATDEISREAEARGVSVLFKPVQIEDLLAMLAQMVRSQKAG